MPLSCWGRYSWLRMQTWSLPPSGLQSGRAGTVAIDSANQAAAGCVAPLPERSPRPDRRRREHPARIVRRRPWSASPCADVRDHVFALARRRSSIGVGDQLADRAVVADRGGARSTPGSSRTLNRFVDRPAARCGCRSAGTCGRRLPSSSARTSQPSSTQPHGTRRFRRGSTRTPRRSRRSRPAASRRNAGVRADRVQERRRSRASRTVGRVRSVRDPRVAAAVGEAVARLPGGSGVVERWPPSGAHLRVVEGGVEVVEPARVGVGVVVDEGDECRRRRQRCRGFGTPTGCARRFERA